MDDKIKALNILNEYKNKLNELDDEYETLNKRYDEIERIEDNLINNFVNIKKPRFSYIILLGLLNGLGVFSLPLLFFTVPSFVFYVSYYITNIINYNNKNKELNKKVQELLDNKLSILLEKDKLKNKRTFIEIHIDNLSKLVYSKKSIFKDVNSVVEYAERNLNILKETERDNLKNRDNEMEQEKNM